MKTNDFQFRNIKLSDYGCIMGHFDSVNLETITSPSITFNPVRIIGKNKFRNTTSYYENGISTIIEICKDPCKSKNMVFATEEIRAIYKWLEVKKACELRFLNNRYTGVFFMGTFTVNEIKLGERTYGFELTFTSTTPFALSDEIIINLNFTNASTELKVINTSDDYSPVYPHLEITVKESGNLLIKNSLNSKNMLIKNCTVNEVITIDCDNQIISSSVSSHNIADDFNFSFFKLCQTFDTDINVITSSLKCEIKMKLNFPRKVGIL